MTIQATLNSFVNRWECDENDHLNVQFYFSRFEEADRQFRLLCGLSETLVGARRVRHVRYHKELRTGDLITVHSSVAFGPTRGRRAKAAGTRPDRRHRGG